MNEHTAAHFERFFAELGPIEAVYADPEFAYLLHTNESSVALISARLVLEPLSRDQPDQEIEVAGFYGFRGRLKSLDVTPRRLVEMLLDGVVPGPDRTWLLTQNDQGGEPLLYAQHQLRERPAFKQQKVSELFGMLLSAGYRKTEEDDWKLRAASTPYSNVNDLMLALGLPVDSHHQLQIVAFPPLLVDATSRVRGEIAELKLRRSRHLPEAHTALGIVVSNATTVTQRARIPGSKFTWAQSEQSHDVLVGTIEVPVEKASVVHCLAVYGDQCFHHYWVGDPDASQNPLRSIYELFDPKFEDAIEMLSQPASRGNSDGQEAAVAALLWVLGFSPLLIGTNSEAPDVIAMSRDSHFVVVECTLSDLQTKKQNKPQKLLDRTNDIREALSRSNAASSVCIPVMVTARKRADILDDIDDCERRGIVVFTQEDIEPLISSTLSSPQSERHFAEVRQRLDAAIARVEGEERLQRDLVRDVDEMKRSIDAINKLIRD